VRIRFSVALLAGVFVSFHVMAQAEESADSKSSDGENKGETNSKEFVNDSDFSDSKYSFDRERNSFEFRGNSDPHLDVDLHFDHGLGRDRDGSKNRESFHLLSRDELTRYARQGMGKLQSFYEDLSAHDHNSDRDLSLNQGDSILNFITSLSPNYSAVENVGEFGMRSFQGKLIKTVSDLGYGPVSMAAGPQFEVVVGNGSAQDKIATAVLKKDIEIHDPSALRIEPSAEAKNGLVPMEVRTIERTPKLMAGTPDEKANEPEEDDRLRVLSPEEVAQKFGERNNRAPSVVDEVLSTPSLEKNLDSKEAFDPGSRSKTNEAPTEVKAIEFQEDPLELPLIPCNPSLTPSHPLEDSIQDIFKAGHLQLGELKLLPETIDAAIQENRKQMEEMDRVGQLATPGQRLSREAAELLNQQAQLSLAEGDLITADELATLSRQALSLALDLYPLTSPLKAFIEILTAHDYITGHDLNPTDQALVFASLIPFGKLFKYARREFKAARELEYLESSAVKNLEREAGAVVDAEGSVTREFADIKYGKRAANNEAWLHSRLTGAQELSAKSINGTYLSHISDPWLPGSVVIEGKTVMKEKFVRVHGGLSEPVAPWIAKEEAIKGLSPLEIQRKYSLPAIPTHIVDVTLPPGTTIRRGLTNSNLGGNAGAVQYEIVTATLDPQEWPIQIAHWFSRSRPLSER